ncbi:MAG TPA: hypothetical protein VMB21_06095 [Candidatus Limnocylindria bacterium]|nr:hypothetical protein [Candidatus Limnocylindria bacterium]
MSLSEFLLRWNERPVLSGFVRRWIPARTDRYSWGRVLAFTGSIAALFAVLLVTPVVILGATGMVPWIALTAAEFGACAGLCLSLVSRLCWNQRTARLAANPDSPEATAPWPRPGRWLRVAVGLVYLVIVGLVTPLLLFHAIENTRGAWAWRQMRAELKARGECYELSCVVPPPARDEDNFFATPFWQQFVYRQERTPDGRLTNIWPNGPDFAFHTNFSLPEDPGPAKQVGVFTQEPTDGRVNLAAWAAQLRSVTTNTGKGGPNRNHLSFPLPATPGEPAADVLLALTKFGPTLDEFAAAAARPRNRYPTHYEEGFDALLPNLAAIKSAARICRLRAIARLGAGDSDGAAADTLLAYRLGESLDENSLLISQLVRIAIDGIAHHALWEGLVAHRWTEPQLAVFQQRLSQLDYTGAFVHALEGERALGNQFMETMINDRARGLDRMDRLGSDGTDEGISHGNVSMGILIPSGWLRQNQIGLLRGYQMILDLGRAAMTSTNRKELLASIPRHGDPVDDYVTRIMVHRSPFNMMVGMLLPALGRATDKADRAQTLAQMAIIACALERHRLAHGTYPATLGELAPAYLTTVPTDWMSGDPFHYQRTEDGWFRLWSVGPNGKDDGGIYHRDTKAQRKEDLDWPWPSPVPSREPRIF